MNRENRDFCLPIYSFFLFLIVFGFIGCTSTNRNIIVQQTTPTGLTADSNVTINDLNVLHRIDTNQLYWEGVNEKQDWIWNNASFFVNTTPPSGCSRALSNWTDGVMLYTCPNQSISGEYNLLGASNWANIANSVIIEYDTNLVQRKISGTPDINAEIRFGLMTQTVATARSTSGIFWDLNMTNTVSSGLMYCVGTTIAGLDCTDTGLDIQNDYHKLRFETHPDGVIDFFVDGSYVGTKNWLNTKNLRFYWSLFGQMGGVVNLQNAISENYIWYWQNPSPKGKQ